MKISLAAAVLTPLLIAAGPATAQSVPAEIAGYNAVLINFNDTAQECNLKDEAMFADHAREKLAEIGITENPESVLTLNIGISAKKFGVRCTTQTVLAFNTLLTSENIVTDNPGVRDALDRLKEFPVTVYRLGRFGVQAQQQPAAGGESTTSQKGVMEMIDLMVATLDDARKK